MTAVADARRGTDSARAVVITCSTRAAAGEYPDRAGPLLAQALQSWGFEVTGPVVVPDGPQVAAALAEALRSAPAVVVTTGGTGIGPGDVTPEATRELLDREIPGIPEALRAAGVASGVPTSVLSRGVAGVAAGTLVVNLPGSSGAVRDALPVLQPVLGHAVDQLRGGDHPRPESPA